MFAATETNGMIDRGFKPRVYLDTNVFNRAFESEPEEAKNLQEVLAFLEQDRNFAVTSELTLAEVLAPPWNRIGRTKPNKRQFYLKLIVWSGFIDLRPVSREILISTADWRAHERVKLPDAIHIVTAVETGCAFLLSSDRDTRRLLEQMTHFSPDPPRIRALMDRLRG